jgi:hypothetical protein
MANVFPLFLLLVLVGSLRGPNRQQVVVIVPARSAFNLARFVEPPVPETELVIGEPLHASVAPATILAVVGLVVSVARIGARGWSRRMLLWAAIGAILALIAATGFVALQAMFAEVSPAAGKKARRAAKGRGCRCHWPVKRPKRGDWAAWIVSMTRTCEPHRMRTMLPCWK